jgi:hypothetical protein
MPSLLLRWAVDLKGLEARARLQLAVDLCNLFAFYRSFSTGGAVMKIATQAEAWAKLPRPFGPPNAKRRRCRFRT